MRQESYLSFLRPREWCTYDTITTSDKWSYLHKTIPGEQKNAYLYKNNIFIVIIFIGKHVVFTVCRKTSARQSTVFHDDTAFSSSGASRMKTFKKINARLQIVILCHQLSFGYGSWIHVNQLLHRNGEEQYRPRTWGALLQLVDRGLTTIVTATTTNKNQPSVSTRFYLINSNRGHTVCM